MQANQEFCHFDMMALYYKAQTMICDHECNGGFLTNCAHIHPSKICDHEATMVFSKLECRPNVVFF